MNWIVARLGEHSTQVALGADLTALIAAYTGQISWQTFLTALVGSLATILLPATSPN